MSNPGNDIDTTFDRLTPDQRKSLIRLVNAWARVESWCLVNRYIGKFVLIGGLGLLILLSQGLDAIKNIFHVGR